MGFISLEKRFLTAAITVFTLCLIWTAAALGENIQLGGGPALDLSRMTIVHQETFAAGQSPDTVFWGLLDIGQKENDPWTGLLANGAYVLMHKGRPGAVRYYFKHRMDQPAKETLTEYALSVDVAGKFDAEPSGAGLIYAYDPRTKHYLGFVKEAASAYAIYRRNEQGLRKIVKGKSNAVKSDQANRLTIVPQGPDINFYINGTHVATLKGHATITGGAGLLAISPGMFAFDNFTLYRPRPPSAVPSNSDTLR
jgi:hypothetical protein